MIKVVSGSWPAGVSVICATAVFRRNPDDIIFQKGFSQEKVPLSSVTRCEVITADSGTANAVGLGIAGVAMFGAFGALMGAQAAKDAQQTLIAVAFKDGRKAVLSGPISEITPIIASGYNWGELSEPPTIEEECIKQDVVSEHEDIWQKRMEAYRVESATEKEERAIKNAKIRDTGKASVSFGKRGSL